MKKTISTIIDSIEANKDHMEFLPTGFRAIDAHLDGGLLKKELVVIGGKTGLGKSYIAGQIFWNIAQKGFKAAYFSLEISNEMVVSRMIGSIANIKPTRVMHGLITPQEREKKEKAKAQITTFSDYMSFYDDVYDLDQIIEEIRVNGYEFLVIDFIQNVFLKENDEYSRLSKACLTLQKMAKELNCCILILSQLSNAISREGAKGNVEYKGSGSIATVCDLGFFMERIEGLDPTSNPIRVLLRKNRRGFICEPWEFTFQHPGGYIS